MTSTAVTPRSAPRFSTAQLLFVAGAILTIAATVVFLADPNGTGIPVVMLTWALFDCALAVGPLARGVQPRQIWALQTASAVCLVINPLLYLVPGRLGPVGATEASHFISFTLTVLWLIRLSRYVGRRLDKTQCLDTAAVTVGMALAWWATVLAPLTDGGELPLGIVEAFYPLADATVLALCLHLARRLQTMPTSLWIFIACYLTLVVLDSAISLNHILTPGQDIRWLHAGYTFTSFAFAVAACHPSIVALSRRPPESAPDHITSRIVVIMVTTIAPAILASAIPTTGSVDTLVRTGLVAILLGLLFSRLAVTMQALSHAEAESRHRATHDSLTGLLSRGALLGAMAATRESDIAHGRYTTVLFLDCDDFKRVNDTWGHHAGDSVLREVARRIPQALGPDDMFARHGGDEFVIVTSTPDPVVADQVAQRIHRVFAEPFTIGEGRTHPVSASIGVAVASPREIVTPDALIGRADAAMYQAKHRGRGTYVLFDDALARSVETRSSVGDRLGAAVMAGDLDIALQPVMGGPGYATLVGWEALARWNDPVLGDVPPDVFVPLAEQLGLIDALGELVLGRACRELAERRRAHPDRDFMMSVNVSPTQLLQSGFAAGVRDTIVEAGLEPSCVRIELTETKLLDTGPAVRRTLDELRASGMHICIDDFGTGYASLAGMMHLPVDCVKLDRSLVSTIGQDADAASRLAAVMALVRSIGIDVVVAEGVETVEQEAALSKLGCPMVQGWLYGRPSRTGDPLPRPLTVAEGAQPPAGSTSAADDPSVVTGGVDDVVGGRGDVSADLPGDVALVRDDAATREPDLAVPSPRDVVPHQGGADPATPDAAEADGVREGLTESERP